MGAEEFKKVVMMKRGLFALLTFFTLGSEVHADQSKLEARIKKYVFEGCAKAEADTAKLSDDEKRTLVVFLGRVLELKLSGTPNLLQDAIKLGRQQSPLIAGYGEGGELWRTFNPNHERQAKECALKILSYVNRNAIGELAKVLSYAVSYHEVGAEREVEEIVSVARHIMRRGLGFVSPEVEQRALLELFELRAETKFPQIDDFASELAAIYPELLVEELLHSSRERRLNAVRLATRLGLGTRATGEQLLDFYNATDVIKRRDIATMLAGYELDEIRVAFVRMIGVELSRGAVPDGDLVNSFSYAIRSLPKESVAKLTADDRLLFETMYFEGKHSGLLQPLMGKMFEAGLVGQEAIRRGLAASDPGIVRATLRLLGESGETAVEILSSLSALASSKDPEILPAVISLVINTNAPASTRGDILLQFAESWLRLPVDKRPNGVAILIANGLIRCQASMRQINRAISIFSAEIEELLKQPLKSIPVGYKEQIKAIGLLGNRSFRLVPRAIADSGLPDIQDALILGILSSKPLDATSAAHIKLVIKRKVPLSDSVMKRLQSDKIILEQTQK